MKFHFFFLFILLLSIGNFSTIKAKQTVKTSLKNSTSQNNNIDYTSLTDSINLIINEINKFNDRLETFSKKRKFLINDTSSFNELRTFHDKLTVKIQSVKNNIETFNSEEKLKIIKPHLIAIYSQAQNQFLLSSSNLSNYSNFLNFCLKNFPIPKYNYLLNIYYDFLEDSSSTLARKLTTLIKKQKASYKKYKQDILKQKNNDTNFIYQYFKQKADVGIDSLNSLSNLLQHNNVYILFVARTQISKGDIYNGICNLQLAYFNTKKPVIKKEIISLIDKLERNNKLNRYFSTIKLENIYTRKAQEEVHFLIYTFGDKNPIILKVNVKLFNYSNSILNLLAFAPTFNFKKIVMSKNTQKAEVLYLYSIEQDKGLFKQRYMVFPMNSAEEDFYYFLNWNAYTGDSIWILYKSLFSRIYNNINYNQFSNVYSAGEALVYIYIDKIAYPLTNLKKVK